MFAHGRQVARCGETPVVVRLVRHLDQIGVNIPIDVVAVHDAGDRSIDTIETNILREHYRQANVHPAPPFLDYMITH
jgi:hypothetical protein